MCTQVPPTATVYYEQVRCDFLYASSNTIIIYIIYRYKITVNGIPFWQRLMFVATATVTQRLVPVTPTHPHPYNIGMCTAPVSRRGFIFYIKAISRRRTFDKTATVSSDTRPDVINVKYFIYIFYSNLDIFLDETSCKNQIVLVTR